MNKKKIIVLISSILIIGAVGGSFAWFTSQDSLTNHFSTAGVPTNNPEDGVKVVENSEWTDTGKKDVSGNEVYENTAAKNITPGTEVNKDVWVKNTATYDSFIRVKLTPAFTSTTLTGVSVSQLDPSLLLLKLANITDTAKLASNQWVDGGDGYYYYLGAVASNAQTEKLLDSVTLSGAADNTYKNAEFDVTVKAESIQASNGAASAEWTSANPAVISALNALQK